MKFQKNDNLKPFYDIHELQKLMSFENAPKSLKSIFQKDHQDWILNFSDFIFRLHFRLMKYMSLTLKFRSLNMGHQGRNRKPCPRTLKISLQILWNMHKNISKICRRISILLEVMSVIVGPEMNKICNRKSKNRFLNSLWKAVYKTVV